MRKLFLTALTVIAVLAGCTTDQIENADNVNSSELQLDQFVNQSNQQTTRNPVIGDGPGISQIECIDDNLCSDFNIPQHGGGLGYLDIHIWYAENMRPSEIECLRSAYFRCFDGDIFMKTWQPTDPHHDIWVIEAGKPDIGLDSTTTDDPRVCNNPTNSCD